MPTRFSGSLSTQPRPIPLPTRPRGSASTEKSNGGQYQLSHAQQLKTHPLFLEAPLLTPQHRPPTAHGARRSPHTHRALSMRMSTHLCRPYIETLHLEHAVRQRLLWPPLCDLPPSARARDLQPPSQLQGWCCPNLPVVLKNTMSFSREKASMVPRWPLGHPRPMDIWGLFMLESPVALGFPRYGAKGGTGASDHIWTSGHLSLLGGGFPNLGI